MRYRKLPVFKDVHHAKVESLMQKAGARPCSCALVDDRELNGRFDDDGLRFEEELV